MRTKHLPTLRPVPVAVALTQIYPVMESLAGKPVKDLQLTPVIVTNLRIGAKCQSGVSGLMRHLLAMCLGHNA
jgi:hypothetical protein